jgi:hypothetical protein
LRYKGNTKAEYKAEVLKVMTVRSLVNGSETGIMRETEIGDKRILQASEMRFFRNVVGYKKQDRRGKRKGRIII